MKKMQQWKACLVGLLVLSGAGAQAQSLTTTYLVSWPDNQLTGDCRFGDTSLGHQAATNTRASGRVEEPLSLSGLAGRRITSIRLNGSSTSFKYDDVMLLAYKGHLLMSSDGRVAEYSAQSTALGTSPVPYVWANILNGLIDNTNTRPAWCSSGATTCTVPPTETYGTLDVDIPDFKALDEAAYPHAPDVRTFTLVTLGDDNPSIDCRHGPVELAVTITSEPMTCTSHPALCGTESIPGTSCRHILSSNSSAPSGVYWLDTCGTNVPAQYYCDMDTPGANGVVGGWTVGGWQPANATTTLGLGNRGAVLDANWSRKLRCLPFTEALVFNRTHGKSFAQMLPGGPYKLTQVPFALGEPGQSFSQGTYIGKTMMGCVGYSFDGSLDAQWGCATDPWFGGTARGHIANDALQLNCEPAIIGKWAWADNTQCSHINEMYTWGIAVR